VGRLTRSKVNALITDFNALVHHLHERLLVPPGKQTRLQRDMMWEHRKQGTDEILGLGWVTEEDIRVRDAWCPKEEGKAGAAAGASHKMRLDPAGRATLAIMRQLGRVREVRGHGHTRIVINNPSVLS
jgi:hypothetical protein